MTTNLKIGNLFRRKQWNDVCQITGFNEKHVWGAWGVIAPMMVTMEEFERLIETGEWKDANEERVEEVHNPSDEA